MRTITTLSGSNGEELQLYVDGGLRLRVDRPGERAVSIPVTAQQLANLAAAASEVEPVDPQPPS